MVGAALGVTLPLTLLAILFALGIGVPLGLAAARRENSLLDRTLMGLARIGIALPAFWLGMLLLQIFAVALAAGSDFRLARLNLQQLALERSRGAKSARKGRGKSLQAARSCR